MPTPGPKLGRKSANRNHLLRNLLVSILLYEHLTTTKAKAKAIQPLLDEIITHAKSRSLASRRYLLGLLFDKMAVKKTFEVLVPRYANRTSGFSRIISLGQRLGDGADMVRIELIDRDVITKDVLSESDDKKKKEPAIEKTAKKSTKAPSRRKSDA